MIETARVSRKRERRRTIAALVVSLLLHIFLISLAVVILSLRPERLEPPPPAEPEPIEVTILPPPEAEPSEPNFIDSAQGDVTEAPPDQAEFESDQNLAAASESTPTNDQATPSVDGEESDAFQLRDREFVIGPVQPPSVPQPETPPRPETEAQPEPAEPETPDPAEDEKVVEAEPTPEPTPPPFEPELALLDPTPQRPRPRPEVAKPEERPELPTRPSPPGYQPQTRTTRLQGGISNQGRASVDAVATPLGRYKKMLSDAIGSRWYYYVNEMLDLVNPGRVELRFIIRKDGKVEGVRVLSNSSNESLAACSVRSIVEAEIPPIPPEIADSLAGERLEVDYSFTIISR